MDHAAVTAKVIAVARFFVPRKNLRENRGMLDGQELAHIRKVLRLAPGDRITLFDDGGWEHDAVIRQLFADRGEVEILRSYQPGRESPLNLTLAVGLTKGEKMDFVVEKATELGVHAIAPFFSTFAVPRWDERKIASRTERWRKIALSASKQCGRTRAPEILQVSGFETLVSRERPDTLKLLFWENERQQSLHEARLKYPEAKSILLAVGPEGGFAAQEAESALAHSFEPIQLGRRILRAETAAVTTVSLVQFLWGDLH
jgi:16S rRNA (uracil1498-N3)-methyltransferase